MNYKIVPRQVFQGIILKDIVDPKHIAMLIIELI